MANAPNPPRPLSEIGHLFLSSIRQKQTNGAPLPRRQPPAPPASSPIPVSHPVPPARHGPARRDMTIDLSPEEFAQVYGETTPPVAPATVPPIAPPIARQALAEPEVRIPPVSAVIASHLNGKQFDRVKEYARHLAAEGRRVGLIEVDASEFRVMCFDVPPQGGGTADDEPVAACFDARAMTAAIDEMSWDVDCWLLCLPNPRTNEARELLRAADHWVLLATCDHDGVVSAYRTLKGLSDLHRPRLSLALLEARNEDEAGRIYRKLAGVCGEFLAWPLEQELPVQPSAGVAEYRAMCCRPMRDKAQGATAPQWRVVADFLTRARTRTPAQTPQADEESLRGEVQMNPKHADMPGPSLMPEVTKAAAEGDVAEVIELGDEQSEAAAILAAAMRGEQGCMVECPVTPPMCAEAKLAVTREKQLVLLAVAKQGMGEMGAIAQAYGWVVENLGLIAMAVPQLAIDGRQTPRLRLLVDQADRAKEMLEGLLDGEAVEVRTYRKVRWGEKNGVIVGAV